MPLSLLWADIPVDKVPHYNAPLIALGRYPSGQSPTLQCPSHCSGQISQWTKSHTTMPLSLLWADIPVDKVPHYNAPLIALGRYPSGQSPTLQCPSHCSGQISQWTKSNTTMPRSLLWADIPVDKVQHYNAPLIALGRYPSGQSPTLQCPSRLPKQFRRCRGGRYACMTFSPSTAGLDCMMVFHQLQAGEVTWLLSFLEQHSAWGGGGWNCSIV